ncbi:MAG: alpha/beta hydrolase [Puniceicoccaceae bacterium]|nr:MAG: alpha/beta hydrolase [Puniceicoccaceae bacterium]
MKRIFIICLGLALSNWALAVDKVAPTHKDVSYGPHERHNLNFWQVDSATPLGILIQIHGGGWIGGKKADTQDKNVFELGYHTASINYPLVSNGDIQPAMAHAAARAVQFIRYKAEEWNIDPSRIMLTGGSAGAASSMWLATHDDMANPDSEDPIARLSTRVAGAHVSGGQTTLDPFLIEKRIGPEAIKHGMLFKPFGVESVEELKNGWEGKYRDFSNEYTALKHLSKDDPPMFLRYKDAVFPARDTGHGIHHGIFGLILKERADEVGAEVYLQIGKDVTAEMPLHVFVNSILIEKEHNQ